jgi:predicted RNA polymerase sigma factor
VSLDERAALATVLRVLYLVFNAGYSGDVDLSEEAIRVARRLHVVTDHPEVAGLLASMLLHHARRAAPTRPDGALARDRLGEYRAQAAIAALHCDPAARQRPAGCRSSSGTTN